MAQNKNQMMTVPLGGDLNFSKLKTAVTQYNGYNDLNSPLYGGALTPLHYAQRDKNSPGNDRPYLKDGYLYDKYGNQLLNVTNYKGLKREELDIPATAIAVFDKDNYVSVERGTTGIYTAINYVENGTPKSIALGYKAVAATYSEASQKQIFIAEKGKLHVYDFNTHKELASTPSVDSDSLSLNVFYDPLSDWTVVSSWQSFADWKYKTLTKYTDTNISADYSSWEAQRKGLETELETAKLNLETYRTETDTTYDTLKKESDQLNADIAAVTKERDSWAYTEEAAWTQFWIWVWVAGIGAIYAGQASYAKGRKEEAQKELNRLNEELKQWQIKNDKAYKEAEAKIKELEGAVNKADAAIKQSNSIRPPKYGESRDDLTYFIGEAYQPAYNFIFDKRTNRFIRKLLNIPYSAMPVGTKGPDSDSYVITGIYDMHLKGEETGKWQSNTNDDYIRYRLAVIPHGIDGNGKASSNENSVFFFLNYTPKIHFRTRNVNESWDVTADYKTCSKTYILAKRDGLNGKPTDFFMSGTGRNSKPMTWMSVLYDPLSAGETGKGLDFNDINLAYDLGEARYTFYSPWSAGSTKRNPILGIGVTKGADKTTGTGLSTKGLYNFDVCSTNLFYEKPTSNGETIKRRSQNFIFRELVNNGVRDTITVTESPEAMGTIIETMGTLDDDTPIFYREGKDGHSVVVKTNQNKWIDISVTDSVDTVRLLNDRFAVLETANTGNAVDLETNKVIHFAPDWNNRFSLTGSPFKDPIYPLSFPAVSVIEHGLDTSSIKLCSGINSRFEITGFPVSGYSAGVASVESNAKDITPVGFVSDYDTIDFYFADLNRDETVPSYYVSVNPETLGYSLFTNIDLAGVPFPSITRIPGLFCKIRPSNFGRFYLDDDNVFYSLLMYNGKVFYAYYENSFIDDVKELFMVQGQTFAITRSDYLYSVFVDQNGVASLSNAIINVKGLTYCGAIPDMALFYSPLNRTIKSFTADHILKDIEPATAITWVGTSTYNPETNSIYIPTNNGVYVYSANNKYRLPLFGVKEIYFGGWNNEHSYFLHEKPNEEGITQEYVTDYIYNPDTSITPKELMSVDSAEYKMQPLMIETKYYGLGNNAVTTTDCAYFRLYSDIGPVDCKVEIEESTLTDGIYNKQKRTINLTKRDWDKDTNTAYIRYQPAYQKSVGMSLRIVATCAISDIGFSVSQPDNTAMSKKGMSL